ncbi:MAG: bifunctional riboflavin kinase/FAD synthetase [Caldisericaceae bacterium]
MKILKQFDTFKHSTAVTIGMFDGVHIGHRKLIEETFNQSEELKLVPLVYTFSMHPLKEKKRALITTLNEKLFLVEKLGIDVCYVANLDNKFMKLSPLEFVEKELIERLNTKVVVVGENFRFGYKKSGDINTLITLGNQFKIKVITVEPITVDGYIVSSSLIHDIIKEGDIEKANKLLGHTFFVQGVVEKGKGLGKHLGFPTINLKFENHNKLLPPNGIYITLTEIDKEIFRSVTNVGFNPTVEDQKRIHIESHIIDKEGNFYEQFTRVHFIQKIREEIKFDNLKALRLQVAKDIEITKAFFQEHNVDSIKVYF